MKGKRGFTLIELAVVLAVIAVLAAILTPLVSNYIDQARIARAMSEARTVADAIRLFHRDVGKYPIYTSMTATTTASSGGTIMVGPGTTPTFAAGQGWFTQTTISLVTQLATNAINAPTGAKLGAVSYRGPYLAALEADPWGNAYVVTATNLHSGSDFAFVISGGPDGTIETDMTQANSGSFTCTDDDVCVVIK